jgi:hypothetical protein
MKLFAFILLVTLVVGDGFYQPFSPVLKASFPARWPFLPNYPYNVIYTINPIPTMPYYDYKKNPHQGVFLVGYKFAFKCEQEFFCIFTLNQKN